MNLQELFLLLIMCVLLFENIEKGHARTNVVSNLHGLRICLTSEDNLYDCVDPRKLISFIDKMRAIKVELIKGRQYYEYCGRELKLEMTEFLNWLDYTILKIDTELDFAESLSQFIHKKSELINVMHLDFEVEPLHPKVIPMALKEMKRLNVYYDSGEASKCVQHLKKMYEITEDMTSKFYRIKKFFSKFWKKGKSSEENNDV